MTPTRLLIGQILAVFAIVTLGVWAATEWAAAMLAFQPQLGSPWFRLGGFPLYRPWALFGWWFHFDAHAPKVFVRAGTLKSAAKVHRIASGAECESSIKTFPVIKMVIKIDTVMDGPQRTTATKKIARKPQFSADFRVRGGFWRFADLRKSGGDGGITYLPHPFDNTR